MVYCTNLHVLFSYLRHMTITPLRRFYFQIPSANIFECVWALSFTDAKAIVARDWMPWWNQIEWLNLQ